MIMPTGMYYFLDMETMMWLSASIPYILLFYLFMLINKEAFQHNGLTNLVYGLYVL